MIEGKGLATDYGDKRAVEDLTFTVRPGIVTGFLGPNGSGKSTTMPLILGLDRPTSGDVSRDRVQAVIVAYDAGLVRPRAREHPRRRARRPEGEAQARVRAALGPQIGLAFLILLVALTLAAVAFDLATAHDQRPATSLYPGPFAKVGDTLVAYRRWGASGTPIVLLGGAAESTWVWHEVGPLLAAQHHRVYALDLPPFGYTQRRGPYTMAGWVALVRGFDARLGIRRPVLVGHSLGAGVAASYALRSPRAVRGIVLLDGDALPIGHGIGWFSHLLVFPYYPALFRLLTGSDWLVGRVLRNAWGPHPPPFSHAFLAEFERPFRVEGTGGALKQLASGGIPGVSLAELRTLSLPRAVVWGAHDTVDPVASGRTTAAALRVPLVLIPGAGHVSMLADPRAVAAAIGRFAGSVRTGH